MYNDASAIKFIKLNCFWETYIFQWKSRFANERSAFYVGESVFPIKNPDSQLEDLYVQFENVSSNYFKCTLLHKNPSYIILHKNFDDC